MSISTPTETVKQIGRLNLSGNVIPSNWWQHIKLPSGKPDSTAIILLADIVYWYRPSEIRDEVTGELKGWRKRFHGDKLQRSYQAFANQFGFSKREATDALKRLRAAGLITLELRTVTTLEGTILNNVLYVEVVPEAIYTITNNTSNQVDEDAKSGTPVTFERNTPYVETEPLLHPDVRAPTLKSDTYTEITTEITTESNSSCPDASQPDEPEHNVNLDDEFLSRHPDAVVFSPKKRQWGTVDDLTCAKWIWQKVLALYEQAAGSDGEVSRPKEPNWVLWANEIRLMCAQDGRTHRQICELFSRVNRDPFWCRNVLSPAKLREQWDKLTLHFSNLPVDHIPRGGGREPFDLDSTDWLDGIEDKLRDYGVLR